MREKKGLPSGLIQLALSGLLCTGLVCRSLRIRSLFFLPICLLYVYGLLFVTSKSREADFVFKLNITEFIFRASDFLLLCDVQRDLRHNSQEKAIGDSPLKERWWWALRLLASPRGIGWNFDPTSHLPSRPSREDMPSKQSRRRYILNQVFWIAVYLAIWRLASHWNRSNPRFPKNIVPTSAKSVVFPWWWRATVWATIVDSYAFMTLTHSAMSVVAVSLRISDPQDWPPIFASPLEAYTIRRYWG